MPHGLTECFHLGSIESHVVPAKLFYVVHCFRQGDALGFRQKHHEATTDRRQDACQMGRDMTTQEHTD